MKRIPLGKTGEKIPAIAVGCMRISGMDTKSLSAHIAWCMEHGMNFFDHADIYGGGACEEKFAEAYRQTGFFRRDVILQSKCGIRPGFYDFSKKHILSSVDGILKRLKTDYLDILLLHRPDALMEPEEVAEAFSVLETSGKVRYFGVSNHRPGQIRLLKKYVGQELSVNQLQFSLPFSSMVTSGLQTNMQTEGAVDRDGGILDYCRLHEITVQAWSPFQYGFFEGPYIGNAEKFPELNRLLNLLAEKYSATPTAVAAAWILRHPARMQLVAGTCNTCRMTEIAKGSEISLSREDWYQLYRSCGNMLP